jgi:hypothetical protein
MKTLSVIGGVLTLQSSPSSYLPLAGRSDDALSGGVGVGAKRLTPPGDPGSSRARHPPLKGGMETWMAGTLGSEPEGSLSPAMTNATNLLNERNQLTEIFSAPGGSAFPLSPVGRGNFTSR